MRNRSNTTFYIFFLLFGLFSTSLYAQQNPVVRLEGEKMRTAVQVTKGISTLTLCGLEPGISYSVIAVPMAYGQESTFEIAPAPALTKGTGGFPFMREGKNALKFAAPSACVDIQVNARSTEQGEQLPMYLTISSEMKATPVASTRNSAGKEGQAILQVQGGFSAEELVKDVLVGGGCFQISNVSFSGLGSQIGKFSKGLTNIGFDNGLIMATGNIDLAPGPNDHDGSSFGYGINTPDADLQTLTAGTIYDMANIEFDFVPTQNQVVFEFAFASEEYCEYVNTNFNDVFGFFISGPGIVGTKNIAVIPATNTPISINTLNHLVNSGLYTHNTPITGKNCGILPAFGQAVLELQYDGFTKKMTAIANVIPCQSYHIKLKIADVADGVWDSAVFFRANSFNAGGTVLASPAYLGGFAAAFESCDAGNIRFRRSNTNTSLPLPINFTIGGSATPGVDYVPIPNFVVIPAGQMEVLAPITVLPDLIPEGPENILVTIPNSCSCSQSTIEFVINDRPSLVANASDQLLCEGEIATLQAAVTGGIPGASIQYQWSTGVTTASIQSSTAGAYSVTVSDGCSIPAVATFGLAFTVCSCEAETFIKTIGKAGQNVRGYAIYDSQDGNLYLTGSKLDSAAIIKITPAGTVLWMRTFDVKNGAVDRISELIVDSEGMLVGCGQSGDLQPDVTGFVFRYNPVTNNLQWVNTYGLETPYVMGLMELPNGNYLIYDNPHLGVNDNRMLEITRSDGAILTGSPLSQKLNLGGGDNFNSALIFNGRLYGVGRYTNGSDFVNMRHALSSIDLATGNVIWSRLSHIDANENARLYGMDLLIEDNHIISVGFGSEVDDNLNNSQLFLQKTSLNGNLIWVKRFDITEIGAEVVDELVSVPDGFILYARGSNAPSDLYLIKTDKNGVLQWSKKLDYGFNDYVATASTFQSQILVKDNHLFFVASTEGPGESQMLIAKTTLDGTVEGNCDFIKPVPVITSAVTNPANFSVNLEKVPFDELTFTIVRTPAATQMQVQNQCKVFINQQQQFSLCFGESVTIGGLIYTQDTTFLVEIPGNGGCDTLRTYSIDLLPQITRNIAVTLCPGDFVLIGGQMIDHAGTFILSIDGMNGACDTTEIYTIASAPYQTRSESISFCEGSSVTIGGQVYNQSGIVIDTIPAVGACDTIVTYTITKQPKLSRAETLVFCPGESIILGGTAYTQPGTVELNLPSSTGGCDTLVTYTLLFGTPAPSNVSITCPSAITIGQPGGSGGAVVNYNLPAASSDCTCPGIELSLTSGLASGSNFPDGATSVCYTATDSCGQTKSCCFTVTIEEDNPCDTKLNGCIKYELLTITEDPAKNRTYRIRVTNNCSNKLLYTAIQVPDGLVAIEPANFSTYTAPSGNNYLVRSPNFSPQYSIRYSSVSDSINNGESDIFKYTLPAQANVTFIHVVSRLAPYVYLGAHLNTFYCPIGTSSSNEDRVGEERNADGLEEDLTTFEKLSDPGELLLFPNPSSGDLFADFSHWQGEQLQVQILNSRGQRIQMLAFTAGDNAQAVDLKHDLPNGLYLLEVLTEHGEKRLGRFVIQR